MALANVIAPPPDITELSNCVQRATINSSNPFAVKLGDYGAIILVGFAQGIGSIGLLIRKSGSSVLTVKNLNDGSDFSSSYFDIHIKSGATAYIEITSTVANNSYATMLISYM